MMVTTGKLGTRLPAGNVSWWDNGYPAALCLDHQADRLDFVHWLVVAHWCATLDINFASENS